MTLEKRNSLTESSAELIPNDWTVSKIADLGNVYTGKTPATRTSSFWKGDIPFVSPVDMDQGKYVFTTERHVTREGAEELSCTLPKNAVLVACIGSIGKTALTSTESITNQQINAIVCNKQANPHYVYYAISSQQWKLKSLAGKAVVPIIKKSLFEKVTVLLPPLPEQNKIAEILSAADHAIEAVDEIVQKTEVLKRGVMQAVFNGGLGHKVFRQTEIGTLPDTWQLVKLGEVLQLCQYGLSLKLADKGGYRILKMDDLVNGKAVGEKAKYVDLDDRTFEAFKLLPGDVLFNRTNSYELVGRTGIFLLKGEYVFASYLIRLRPNKSLVDPLYLTYLLIFANERLRKLASRAVHQANINATNLRNFKIPLPLLQEQKRISEMLTAFDERLDILRKKKEKLLSVKRGLMNDLLTGKKRVTKLLKEA